MGATAAFAADGFSPQIVGGLLIAVRLFGILALIPGVAGRSISWTMRLVLSFLLTIVLAPVCVPSLPQMLTVDRILPALGQELVLGLLLGAGVQALLYGVQVAGQLVSQMAGISLSTVFDQESGTQVSAYTRFLDLLATSVFLLLGGHRWVIGALLETFQESPPGSVVLSQSSIDVLAALLTQSFRLGIEAALPVLATLFVSNVLAGMLGRIMPQINVLLLSGGLNSLLMMASVLLGVGVTAWTLEFHLGPMVDQVKRLCGG